MKRPNNTLIHRIGVNHAENAFYFRKLNAQRSSRGCTPDFTIRYENSAPKTVSVKTITKPESGLGDFFTDVPDKVNDPSRHFMIYLDFTKGPNPEAWIVPYEETRKYSTEPPSGKVMIKGKDVRDYLGQYKDAWHLLEEAMICGMPELAERAPREQAVCH